MSFLFPLYIIHMIINKKMNKYFLNIIISSNKNIYKNTYTIKLAFCSSLV